MKKAIASLLVMSMIMLGATAPAPETAQAATTAYNATYGLKIVEAAKSLIGKVSYEHAYDPATLRLDCSGYTYEVFKRAGINLGSIDDDEQAKIGEYVAKSELQPGDLVFFWNSMSVSKTDVGHVGIYIGNGQYIHNSDPTSDVIISSINTTYANEHYITARRAYPVDRPVITGYPTQENIADMALSLKEKVKWDWVYNPTTLTFNAPGFANYVYDQAGIKLGLTAYQATQATELYKKGTFVSWSNLQKGDLVFFGASATDLSKVTYVGIYLGDGMFIHAYGPKMPILISDINKDSYKNRYMGAKRILTQTTAPAPVVTVTGTQVVTAATNLQGHVQYGAVNNESTLTFDSAGYVSYAFKKAGLDLKTNNVAELAKLGTAVTSQSALKPGDMIFFWSTTPGVVGHVGIYLGNGNYIQNPDAYQDVCIKSLNREFAQTRYMTARRVTTN